MKRYILILLTLFFCIKANSQDVEGLLTHKTNPCENITINSYYLIPVHFEKNNMDTVSAIVKFWEKRCGINEPLLRIKILLAIKADTLNESIYNELPIIKILNLYRDLKRDEINGFNFNSYYLETSEMNSFDNFTKEFALKLKKENKYSGLELFFLDFYSNNFENILARLEDATFTNTKLKQAYEKETGKYINRGEGHFAMYSGLWVPTNNLRTLGNHTIIGFQSGLKKKKVLIDFALEFKFGKSPNNYLVEKDDSIYTTNYFFGGYFGLELGYELFAKKSNEINLLAGTGWEGIDVLSIGKTDDPNYITESINALNLNIGIGYRKYLKNKNYYGIDLRYNFVDYHNNNGTNLAGNTFTIRLKFGVSRNFNRDVNLSRLDNKKFISSNHYNEWLQNMRRIRY